MGKKQSKKMSIQLKTLSFKIMSLFKPVVKLMLTIIYNNENRPDSYCLYTASRRRDQIFCTFHAVGMAFANIAVKA